MEDPPDAPRPKTRGGWSFVPWLLLALIALGIVLARRAAPDLDHALANIITVVLVFAGWIVALVAFYLTPKRRSLMATVALAPIVVGLVGLSLFKFERLDSELVPHFRSRWTRVTPLPSETAASGAGAEMFAARETDFPQFLGPTRDGRVSCDVDPDWQTSPPLIVWKQPIGPGWSGFAIQGDVGVTMEQRDQSEWVSAYSLTDGSLLWKYEIPARHTTVPGGAGPRSTPLIANHRVYACSAVSEVVCLNLTSGEPLWSHDLLELAGMDQIEFEASVTWGRAGSPLIVDQQLIVPFGGKPDQCQPLIAFTAESGQENWRGGKGQISYSSPTLATVDGVQQILFVSEGKVAGYEIDSGKVLWESKWPGSANANPAVAQPVIVDDTRLLLGKGYGEGAELIGVSRSNADWTVHSIWKNTSVMKTKFTTAVVRDGFAYGLSDGILECIDVVTGEKQWKRGRYRHGQLLLLQDLLLILSEAGELVLVAAQPTQFEELAKFPVISDVSWNTMALSGNRLMIRNSEEVACVLLPLAPSDDSASIESTAWAPAQAPER